MKLKYILIGLLTLSMLSMGSSQMYEEDLSGSQSWDCYTNGRSLDQCTTDATGSYSSPPESAKAYGQYEICGRGGIRKDFDFAREPKYLSFDYRIKLDSWGKGTIFINDSSGVTELIDERRSGDAYDSGWRNTRIDVSNFDKEFSLTAGSISSSSYCSSTPEDRSWTVWIDDLKVTSSADKPNEPSFRNPQDEAVLSTTTVKLTTRITDPNDDTLTVEFKDSSGSNIDTFNSVQSGETVSTYWSGLSDGNTYDWYVRACDGTGQCRVTDTWSFEVDASAEKSFTGGGLRDEDYNPEGRNTSMSDDYYTGFINKLEDASNQLEPGMDTDEYPPGSYGIWEDSDGSQGSADQWAITKHLNWSISNRGTPYPPGPTGESPQMREGGLYHSGYQSDGGTYYHKDYSGRFRRIPTDTGEFTPDSVPKTVKVFGNSFAGIAAKNFSGDFGKVIKGDGVWVDPDDIRSMNDLLVGEWREKLVYNIDLTGPDMGIGFNLGNNYGINYRSGYGSPRSYVMYGNVYFQGEADGIDNDGDNIVDEEINSNDTVGETMPSMEPPMCGDDRREYLLEELGESMRSKAGDGKYACAQTQDLCVDMSADGSKVFEIGTYRQTDEPDEDFGRAKNDAEVCSKVGDAEVARWYDQDFNQNLCRENSLYGDSGVQWFTESEIAEHPAAFKGGIDDDFNLFLEEYRQLNGTTNKNLISDPGRTYSSSSSLGTYSPVPTGGLNQRNGIVNDTIATPGFCGGDDSQEYIVTQDCVTSICETDNTVIGVAANKGSCIMDLARYNDTMGSDKRKLFQPGDQVDIDLGNDVRTLSCYGSTWYEEWPVVFRKDEVQIPRGSSRLAQFQLINVENTELTFNVELRDSTSTPWNDPWSFFSQDESTKSDTFQVTLGPESSRTYTMSLYGGNQNVDNTQLTVYAESDDGTITGSDSIRVNVTEPINQTISSAQGSGEAVPGIGLTQIVTLMLLSSTAYLFMAKP